MIYWEIDKTTVLFINKFIRKEKDDETFQVRVMELAELQEIINGDIILTGNSIGKYLHKGFKI